MVFTNDSDLFILHTAPCTIFILISMFWIKYYQSFVTERSIYQSQEEQGLEFVYNLASTTKYHVLLDAGSNMAQGNRYVNS